MSKKKVKYKVTGPFGLSKVGDIRDAILLLNNDGQAILYHPQDGDGGCASLEFCVQNGKGQWVTAPKALSFLNIDCQKDLDKLLKRLKKIKYYER